MAQHTSSSSNSSTNSSNSGKYSSVLHQPVFDQLEGCNRILIAGCGGGYDFFAGIPLFFALRKAGAECFLANLAFSDSSDFDNTALVSPQCWKVTAESKRLGMGWTPERDSYWPELKVSIWLKKKHGIECPVYLFAHEIGVPNLKAAYEKIIAENSIDAILLVDGGTDSLMFGNEQDLGTPTEDMTSICAVNMIKTVKKKVLFNLGLGIDCFHGVSHHLWLENLSVIAQSNGFLGSFSLQSSQAEAKEFQEVYEATNPENSIVCSSVLSATQGYFGNRQSPHTASRTRGSSLYISALMAMYFAFDLGVVASHVFYLDKLVDAKSHSEVRRRINEYRNQFYKGQQYVGPRPGKPLEY